jgi:hypothetical protein
MSLADIYASKIKNNPIKSFSIGSNFPTIENRDKTIDKLQQNLSAKLQEIMPKENIQNNQPIEVSLKPFSLEDAIKELIELKK